MEIDSIGFNYSLVTSKQFAICLLKMTLEHSSFAYISKSFWHTFKGDYNFFVKLLDNIFSKHKVEEYLARDYFFLKEKATYLLRFV